MADIIKLPSKTKLDISKLNAEEREFLTAIRKLSLYQRAVLLQKAKKLLAEQVRKKNGERSRGPREALATHRSCTWHVPRRTLSITAEMARPMLVDDERDEVWAGHVRSEYFVVPFSDTSP
jgi:hypothetical protein